MNKYIKKVFEIARQHFVVEGNPFSYNKKTGQCSYKDKDSGAKCPIGILIPDSLYSERMEECSVLSLLEKFPEVAESFRNSGYLPSEDDPEYYDTLAFLETLQEAHDSSVHGDNRILFFLLGEFK